MSEHPSSDQNRFKQAERMDGLVHAWVLQSGYYINASWNGLTVNMNVVEAREFRDWLNKVLP